MNKSEGICDMCGHFILLRQKAHIIAEGGNDKNNLLMLCPSCHLMFDTHLKPKIFKALKNYGIKDFPVSWEKSIYEQAADESLKAKNNKIDKKMK